MKNFRKFICFYIVLTILSSCGTIKKGFENPKKNSSDEFLVEKKSPLVMPPEFSELPVPKNQKNNIKNKKSNIKDLIGQKKQDNESDISNKDLEGSILEKINTD